MNSSSPFRVFTKLRHKAQRLLHLALSRRVINRQYSDEEIQQKNGYSQCGQDLWVIESFFPEKRNGIFVDIGAHDGVSYNNTWKLEQRGWKGLAIEPNPAPFARLESTRSCDKLNACVGIETGAVKFRALSGSLDMLSGIVSHYPDRHIERIEREKHATGERFEDIDVECYSLNRLLEAHHYSEVDYLSLDVEGAEYSILQSLDFDRFHISVIGVENNYRDPRIPLLLMRRGFAFHSIVGDEFYVNSHYRMPSS